MSRNFCREIQYLFIVTIIIILNVIFIGKHKRHSAKKLRRKISRGGKTPVVKQQQMKRPRGRVRKTKPKKAIKITGLDLLHSQTLLSTSPQGLFFSFFLNTLSERLQIGGKRKLTYSKYICHFVILYILFLAIGKKLPPAPGCVDQQLTTLSSDLIHTELEIPQAPAETPYALQILLDIYRLQFMQMIDQMKNDKYKEQIETHISKEKERNHWLQNRAAQLEKQIKVLIDDSVALLKARMNELGINANSPGDLLAKAKEIVCRHKELQAKASKLQAQVSVLEQNQSRLVAQRQQEIIEKYRRTEPNIDVTQGVSQEFILREISSTLSQRKKLHNQVSRLENELLALEKTSEDRKQTNILSNKPLPAVISKQSRKSRDYRTRSQDWPDVPDIGKIEEQNPEILAQKILETGRKIEASKLFCKTNYVNFESKERNSSSKSNLPQNQRQSSKVNNNMPAPMHVKRHSSKSTYIYNTNRISEPPRVVNFEDRLKSIITSVLNEDEQFRSKQASTKNNCMIESHVLKCNQNANSNPKQSEKSNIEHKNLDQPNEFDNKDNIHQEGLAATVLESYRKESHIETISANKQLPVEQPDYTQVSPAKLALRRHLSQEKLAAQQPIQYQHSEGGIVAARTIGDLMSGEIERTLEISNQSIINAAVDMSDIHGTTTVTSRSVMNQNVPPRPERVNVKMLSVDVKEQEPMRQIYSPISRPSSAEGGANAGASNISENLAYLQHHSKANISHGHNIQPHCTDAHGHITPNVQHMASNNTVTVSIPQQQNSPRTTVLYPTNNNNNGMYKMINSRPVFYPKGGAGNQYTPLPRADIKPYQESYFTDTKPPMWLKVIENSDCMSKSQFVPEGLAATLHARVLNNVPVIKEEIDEPKPNREYNVYELNSEKDRETERSIAYSEQKVHNPVTSSTSLSYSNETVTQNIKAEVCDNVKSSSSFQCLPQKRVSPVIQAPVLIHRKILDSSSCVISKDSVGTLESVRTNVTSHRNHDKLISPEPDSNISTSLADEVSDRQRRPEEGKTFVL